MTPSRRVSVFRSWLGGPRVEPFGRRWSLAADEDMDWWPAPEGTWSVSFAPVGVSYCLAVEAD